MKKIILILTVLFIAISCNRNDDNNTPLNPTTTGFTWKENTTSATAKTAGSAELRTTYKSIFAFAGTTATSGTIFEINLTGVAPATYDLATLGNAFYFKDFPSGGTITGKVIITSNSGGKASGTFEAFTTASGAITKVYGTFTDIPVN